MVTVICISFSCGNDEVAEQSKLYQQIIKTEKGIVRGVEINATPDQIKQQESKRALMDESANYLEYEYEITEEAFVVVTYHFDEKGCSEISIDTYFDTPEKTTEVIAIYQKHFTAKYGKPIVEDNLNVWHNTDKTISVELDYLSQDDGEIMLTIYATD